MRVKQITEVYPWRQVAKCILVGIVPVTAKVLQSLITEGFKDFDACSGPWFGPVYWWNSLVYF